MEKILGIILAVIILILAGAVWWFYGKQKRLKAALVREQSASRKLMVLRIEKEAKGLDDETKARRIDIALNNLRMSIPGSDDSA